MSPKRKWPTVSTILRRAETIEDRMYGARYRDRETGAYVTVHASTMPNLLQAIRGTWKLQDGWPCGVWHRPAEAPK